MFGRKKFISYSGSEAVRFQTAIDSPMDKSDDSFVLSVAAGNSRHSDPIALCNRNSM